MCTLFLAGGLEEAVSRDLPAVLAIGGGLTVALVSIVTCAIRGVVRTRAVEQTKRELAAYVADGTMKPEDAERILQADRPKWERS
jgi:hypothetical protein